jgi:predicted permease
MLIFRRIVSGFRRLFHKTQVEQDMDEELRAYLETAAEQKMEAGVPREAAVRAARVEIGSVEAIKEGARDIGWESEVESCWQDVRYALRSLRKSPGFTAVAVLTLALGIGATTAIFSLLEAVILKSLPVRNPEELVLVGPRGFQIPAFQAFREHTDIFVDLLATSGVTPLDVDTQAGVREPTGVSLVSGSYFSTLGIQASIGRIFTVNEDRAPGEYPVAVASYGYWQRRFGGDAAILNRVVRIGGTPITIIGVAPQGFFGEQVGVAPDLWVPLAMWGQVVPGRNLLQSPGTAWLRVIGRVRPGVTASGVQLGLTRTFQQVLTGIFPNAAEDERRDIARATVTLEPAGTGVSNVRAQFARPLQMLMGAVVLVLLIACANIANLLLARGAARRREIDVRLALGMSRARLIRQLLTESLVLAALGGAAGLAIAWLGREALLRLISADGSRLPVAVTMDARLLVFVAVISSATAILFGLAPAWQSARASLVTSLVARCEKGGRPAFARGGFTGLRRGRPRQRLSAALVIAQVALSLVLLTGAGLFLRTIANLRDVDLGFSPERLLILDVNPQAAGYSGDRAIALHRRLLDNIKALPGVSSVSLSEHGVLTGRDSSTNRMRSEGFVAGPEGFPQTRWDVVGPRYFSTMGTRLLSGRDFTERDDSASPYVVAINEEMARFFFAGADPIGRRLVWDVGGGEKEFEIVAVTREVKLSGPRDERQMRFYLPYFQLPLIRPTWVLASTRFLVRTAADPALLAPLLRQLIPSEDPRLSVASLDVGPELVSRALYRERMVATLLVAFGVLAIGLACLGLYGLIAFHVVQRTSEIGIRMALGAQRSHVLWVTLRRGLAWIAAGVAVGIPLALGASRVAQGLLFGLSATDPGPLIGAAGVMSAMGLLAAYIPARRATRVEPMVALRCE